jgi:hypothetical protein
MLATKNRDPIAAIVNIFVKYNKTKKDNREAIV